MKRWIRASCPAQRGFGKKRGFCPKPRPTHASDPAAAGHILCLGYTLVPLHASGSTDRSMAN